MLKLLKLKGGMKFDPGHRHYEIRSTKPRCKHVIRSTKPRCKHEIQSTKPRCKHEIINNDNLTE